MISFGFYISNPFAKNPPSIQNTFLKYGTIVSNISWEVEIYKTDVLVSFNCSMFYKRYPTGHNRADIELGLLGRVSKFTIYTGEFDGCL